MMTTTNCMTAARMIGQGIARDLNESDTLTISRSQITERIDDYLDCPHDFEDFILITSIVLTNAMLAFPDRITMR